MRHPSSEHLGWATGPDGRRYSLHFYGEGEGAAVANVEAPSPAGRAEEVYREPAKDADDALAKLGNWWREDGRPALGVKRGQCCVKCGAVHAFRPFTGQRVYWTMSGTGQPICPECSAAST